MEKCVWKLEEERYNGWIAQSLTVAANDFDWSVGYHRDDCKIVYEPLKKKPGK